MSQGSRAATRNEGKRVAHREPSTPLAAPHCGGAGERGARWRGGCRGKSVRAGCLVELRATSVSSRRPERWTSSFVAASSSLPRTRPGPRIGGGSAVAAARAAPASRGGRACGFNGPRGPRLSPAGGGTFRRRASSAVSRRAGRARCAARRVSPIELRGPAPRLGRWCVEGGRWLAARLESSCFLCCTWGNTGRAVGRRERAGRAGRARQLACV